MKRLFAITLLISSTGATARAEAASQEFRINVPQSVEVTMQTDGVQSARSNDSPNDHQVTWTWSFYSNTAASVRFSRTDHSVSQIAADISPVDNLLEPPSLQIRVLDPQGPGQWLVQSNATDQDPASSTAWSNAVVTGASLARIQIFTHGEDVEAFGEPFAGDRIEIAATISAL